MCGDGWFLGGAPERPYSVDGVVVALVVDLASGALLSCAVCVGRFCVVVAVAVVVMAVVVVLVVIIDGRLIVHRFSSEHKLRTLSDCSSAPFPTNSIVAAGSPITVTITANWGVCASERRRRDPAEEVFGCAVVMS